MIELLVTFLFGALISAICVIGARRSLMMNDLTTSDEKTEKESIKKKPVAPKKYKTKTEQSSKIKSNKNVKPVESQLNVENLNERKKSTEVKRKMDNSINAGEGIKREVSVTEWMQVGKGSKKAIKKEKVMVEPEENKSKKLKYAKKETGGPDISDVFSTDQNEINNFDKSKPNKKTTSEQEIKKKKEVKEVKETVKAVNVKKVEVTPVSTNTPVSSTSTNTTSVSTTPESINKPVDNISTKGEEIELRRRVGELKTENDKLKNTIKEDNKHFTSTNNQQNKELEQLRQKLKNKETAETKYADEIKKKSVAYTDLKNNMQIIQGELTKNIMNVDRLKREKGQIENKLEEMENFNEKLKERIKAMENDSEDSLKRKEDSKNEMLQAQATEFQQQINTVQSEKHHLQETLVRVQSEVIEQNAKLQGLQQELSNTKTNQIEAFNEKMRLERVNFELQTTLNNLNQHKDSENKRVIELEDQIKNIESKCTRTEKENVEIQKILNAEKEQNVKLKRDLEESLKSAVNNSSEEVKDLEDKCRSLTEERDELSNKLLESLSRQSQDEANKEQLSAQIKNLSKENENRGELVEKYKKGLEETENILSNLQKSVNEEEEKWRESLMKSEAESEKSKKEIENVYQDLMRIRSRTDKSELNFAYHCVDKSLSSLIDEMEARMEHLENNLEKVMQERDEAICQMKSGATTVDAINQVNGTAETISSAGDQHQERQHQLESDIERYKESIKNLEMQCNKYKALVEVGKDALGAETERVRSLEQELSNYQQDQQQNDVASS